MAEHAKKQGPAQRMYELWVAQIALREGGYSYTTLYHYPRGSVEAAHPILAWDGIWEGPSQLVVARELVCLHQGLVEVIADDNRRR